jgi:hypothetical protein
MKDDKDKVEERISLLKSGIIEKRLIHSMWREFEKAYNDPNIPQDKRELLKSIKMMFGKFQYIYSSDKGEISLIELLNHFNQGETMWEILCLQGDLFEGTERFGTFEEARDKVVGLLQELQEAKDVTKSI